MSKVVIDCSALVALLEQEKGADKVLEYLEHAVMSVVNYSETLDLLLRDGYTAKV